MGFAAVDAIYGSAFSIFDSRRDAPVLKLEFSLLTERLSVTKRSARIYVGQAFSTAMRGREAH